MRPSGSRRSERHHGSRGRAQRGRKVDSEIAQEADEISGPSDRNRCRTKRIFENQVPSDDPRDELAKRGVA